jgi:hypothetical protein
MVAVTPKADAGWVREFRGKYQAWFQGAKPLLEAHQGAAAFKTYPFVSFRQTPWSPFRIDLRGCPHCLDKPFHEEKLIEEVFSILGRSPIPKETDGSERRAG